MENVHLIHPMSYFYNHLIYYEFYLNLWSPFENFVIDI